MREYGHRGIDSGGFEITRREILASISIIAIMLLIGFLISNKISDYQLDRNEKYNKAVKIESPELFEYGMRTNVGNAFVYGDLKAIDTVTYPEIDGEYMYVEKVKEKYTEHQRTTTYTDSNGKSHTKTEIYWTWDRVGSEEVKCKEISFCGVMFSSNKINIPDAEYITTIKESSRVRYKYHGTANQYTGTIFTELKDKTISDKTAFYKNKTIEKTVKDLESGVGLVIFWIAWSILISGCVFGFYYIDNKWLE